MGPTGCAETSVTNHQSTLPNIADQRRSHWHRCGSLNSQRYITFLAQLLSVANDIQQTRRKWDTVMDITTYELRWAIRGSFHVRGQRFFLLRNVQIQPHIQLIPVSGRGVTVPTQLHLQPRLGMSGAIYLLLLHTCTACSVSFTLYPTNSQFVPLQCNACLDVHAT